jgi:hypothetical protein
MPKDTRIVEMTKLYGLLGLSTALALVASAALADENKSFIDQNGAGNSAAISQSGKLHEAGTTAIRMLQQGDENSLVIDQTNAGTGNIGGNLAGTNGLGIGQIGNVNVLEITQSDQKNAVRQVQQISSGTGTELSNSAIVSQSKNSRVSRILQDNEGDGLDAADANTIDVVQSNEGNKIGTLSGFDATVGLTQIGTANDMDIDQTSGFNEITLAVQDGDRNALTVLQQTGNSNDALNLSQSGDDNDIDIEQTGSLNVLTTLLQSGNENSATVTQTGSTNIVTTVEQDGDDNVLNLVQNGMDNNVQLVDQSGGDNTANLDFQGNSNGVGGFSVGFDDRGLTQGQIIQSNSAASLNLINFTVNGNSNLFAFKQDGTGNTISGTVGTPGIDASSNQAAVLQVGNDNYSSFSQAGTNNAVSISQ